MSITRREDTSTLITDIQKILGSLLALSSTGAMIMVLQSLMHDPISKGLAILAGLALQGCLYLFGIQNSYRMRLFSGLLLLFSVIATTWFMESTWQQARLQKTLEQKQKSYQSWNVDQIKHQIAEINREIQISTTSAENDINANYRGRGNDTLSENESKKKRRSELMAELEQMKDHISQQEYTTVFEASSPLRIGLFALVAMLVDLTAILAFSTLPETRRKSTDEDEGTSKKHSLKPTETSPDPLATILEKIRAGDYGEFVPVKQIVETEPVRHPELKAGIDQLIDEGILVKSGNRYRYAEFEKQAGICMS